MVKSKKQSSHKNVVHYKTFKVNPDVKPFVQFNITNQTIIWSVLIITILVLALWVLQFQLNTIEILDNIKSV